MKLLGICAVFLLVAGAAHGEALAQSDHLKASAQSSVEFRNASGRVIGTVTKIGETTYYTAPDGTPLGTSSLVDGQRVFKTY